MRRDRQMVVIAPQAVRMAAPVELGDHPDRAAQETTTNK
jgi:hypothetical protein